MLPSRFLWPWNVLEIILLDVKARSEAGNRYLLVMVDRASKFLLAYPLSAKDALEVAHNMMELVPTFSLQYSSSILTVGVIHPLNRERCRGRRPSAIHRRPISHQTQ